MLHNRDVFGPHQNLDGVNHVSSLLDTEDGIYLDELPVGAMLDIETDHHNYRVENRGDGRALISGHPVYCPEAVLVDLHGSTAWGGAILKMRFIGRGMRLEFHHPVRGVISTSRVRDIHELMLAP
jgi:hypothetical protein